MIVRERQALAKSAIESIVAHTARPYRFIYVDVQSPDWLREWLALRADELGLEVVRIDEPLWPQEARRRVVGMIDTDYVVFIDNDVQVEDGWLDSLVACADETGAGIVGPLYLMAGGTLPTLIHMAGGKLTETQAESGRILEPTHLLDHADPAKVADKLFRQPCDFVEYHCMMIRSELLRDGEVLDPRMLSVHEHIDTALSIRQRGYPIFVEPSARVTYLAFAEYMLDDLPLFRERWSREAAESSIDAFCKKWGVVNDDRSFGILRTFVRGHAAQVDPIRASSVARPDRLRTMQREELRQTRSDLLDLATERGYEPKEVAWLASCYHVAQVLTDGGYRPCGRPFINHLAGTASVLIRYDFRIEIVGAGMLHAAYTHCPPHQAGPRATADLVCAALGGKDSALEKRVRAYTKRESDRGALSSQRTMPWTISLADAEITAIAAANEVDMHLSGEFRYSGRTDEVLPHMTAQIVHVCRMLGVDGLAETLLQAEHQAVAVEPEFLTRISFSYRVGPDKRSVVRMVGDAVSALE
jgi:glycosyltransferase involved in cell wall biosynthesis